MGGGSRTNSCLSSPAWKLIRRLSRCRDGHLIGQLHYHLQQFSWCITQELIKKAQGCSFMSHLCQYGCYLFMHFLECGATLSLPWHWEQLYKQWKESIGSIHNKSMHHSWWAGACVTTGTSLKTFRHDKVKVEEHPVKWWEIYEIKEHLLSFSLCLCFSGILKLNGSFLKVCV